MSQPSFYDRFATPSPEPQVEERPKSRKLESSKLSTAAFTNSLPESKQELPVPGHANLMLQGQFVQDPQAFQQDPMLYRQYQLKPDQLNHLSENEVYYAFPEEAPIRPKPQIIPVEIPIQAECTAGSPISSQNYNNAPNRFNSFHPGAFAYQHQILPPYPNVVSFIPPAQRHESYISYSSQQLYGFQNGQHLSYIAPSGASSYIPPSMIGQQRGSYMPSFYAPSSYASRQSYMTPNYGGSYIEPPMAPTQHAFPPQTFVGNVDLNLYGYPIYSQANSEMNMGTNLHFPTNRRSTTKTSSLVRASYTGDGRESQIQSGLAPRIDEFHDNENINEQVRKGSQQSQENLIEKDTEESFRPPRKYMYGCIPINPRTRNYCLIALFVFLSVLGVLGYLLFPRFPDQKVTNIVIANDNSFTLTPVDLTSPSITFNFMMNMIMTVNVTNTNYYPLTISSIDISAFLVANASQINAESPSPAQKLFGRNGNRIFVTSGSQKEQIGSGTYGSITFPPNVPVSFDIPFKVSYTPNKFLGAVNDPAISELIQLCVEDPVLSPTDNRTSLITYDAVNTIDAFSWFGYKPTLSNKVRINCPFQGSAKQAFINAIQGNATTSTKSVQGGAAGKSVNSYVAVSGPYSILAKQDL